MPENRAAAAPRKFEPGEQYCPICARVIVAQNILEVEVGVHTGYIFVHDDVTHTDNDLSALRTGMQ